MGKLDMGVTILKTLYLQLTTEGGGGKNGLERFHVQTEGYHPFNQYLIVINSQKKYVQFRIVWEVWESKTTYTLIIIID